MSISLTIVMGRAGNRGCRITRLAYLYTGPERRRFPRDTANQLEDRRDLLDPRRTTSSALSESSEPDRAMS
jgi:hypothetical protein